MKKFVMNQILPHAIFKKVTILDMATKEKATSYNTATSRNKNLDQNRNGHRFMLFALQRDSIRQSSDETYAPFPLPRPQKSKKTISQNHTLYMKHFTLNYNLNPCQQKREDASVF